MLFGAGQVGYPLAERLLAAGKRVRVAKRSRARMPAGCEVVLGDAADRRFCVSAAGRATTSFHRMNPPYRARIRADLVPRYMDNLICRVCAVGRAPRRATRKAKLHEPSTASPAAIGPRDV